MPEIEVSAELPKYKCHKVVHALKIRAIELNEDKTATIEPEENFTPFKTAVGFADRFKGSEEDNGYYVVYEGGYPSWSPSKAFEEGYTLIKDRLNSGLDFGEAIEALKEGKKVARKGWNGNGMFCFLVAGSTFQVNCAPLNKFYEEGTEVNYHAHIDMKTVEGTIIPWTASQSDILSEDWMIID